MAFVSESKRDSAHLYVAPTTGSLGPGEYHNEGYLHKQTIEAIYPKRFAPFNSGSTRKIGSYSTSVSEVKNLSPGPGAYNMKSNFDIVKYVRQLDDRGTYVKNTGGTLQRR